MWMGGKAPQPSHYRDYYDGRDDEGGVHVNSGIPNHAFYLAAIALDGHSWKTAGKFGSKRLRKSILPAGVRSADSLPRHSRLHQAGTGHSLKLPSETHSIV
jgi:hypothetical protein